MSMGKIQKRTEGGAPDSQVNHRCDEMSRRAPAGGQEEGRENWALGLPSPLPLLSPLPLHLPTHTCHILSEPGIIRTAGSGIIQS